MTVATLVHLREQVGAAQQDIAEQLGMSLSFIQKVEDGRLTLTNTLAALYTRAAIAHMKKVPAPLQWDEDQTIKNQEQEPIMFNAKPSIADTTDIQAVPTSEDGTATTRCTDQACIEREHTYLDGEDYFHTSFLEQSDESNGLGDRLWIITAERLSSRPEWAICAQVQDDLTPGDTATCAAAMLHASVLAGLLNGKAV